MAEPRSPTLRRRSWTPGSQRSRGKSPEQKTPKQRDTRAPPTRAAAQQTTSPVSPLLPQGAERVHTGLSLSQEAVSVMDSIVKDIFERIASEAARLARSKSASPSPYEDIQTSVLPAAAGRSASLPVKGTNALIKYICANELPQDHLSIAKPKALFRATHWRERPVALKSRATLVCRLCHSIHP
nr:histone H2B.2-like [Camelus dromedarius]